MSYNYPSLAFILCVMTKSRLLHNAFQFCSLFEKLGLLTASLKWNWVFTVRNKLQLKMYPRPGLQVSNASLINHRFAQIYGFWSKSFDLSIFLMEPNLIVTSALIKTDKSRLKFHNVIYLLIYLLSLKGIFYLLIIE